MIFVLNWNFLRWQKCSTWMLSAEPATNISCVCCLFSLFSGTQSRYCWQCTQCSQCTQCGYRRQRSLKCCPLKVAVSSQQGLISVCTIQTQTDRLLWATLENASVWPRFDRVRSGSAEVYFGKDISHVLKWAKSPYPEDQPKLTQSESFWPLCIGYLPHCYGSWQVWRGWRLHFSEGPGLSWHVGKGQHFSISSSDLITALY